MKILIEIRVSRFRLVIELKEANQAVCGVDIARRLQLQTVEDFRAQGVGFGFNEPFPGFCSNGGKPHGV